MDQLVFTRQLQFSRACSLSHWGSVRGFLKPIPLTDFNKPKYHPGHSAGASSNDILQVAGHSPPAC